MFYLAVDQSELELKYLDMCYMGLHLCFCPGPHKC